MPLPSITRVESSLVHHLWTSTSEARPDIVMDSTKVNEILEAMGNFTLPAQSIPDWAIQIPGELWKQRLLEKLQNRSSSQ